MVELLISLNWWAVLAATVAYFVLGAIWYSFLFANLWMKLRELNEEDIKDPNPVIFLWSFVLQFIATLTLALFIEGLGIDRVLYGAVIGFGAGAGFVFSLAGTTGLFSDLKLGLHLIDNGYHVIGLTLAGVIIGAW